MDDTANKLNDNNLDLVPPEENPLTETPVKDEADNGAIGDSLDPSKFDTTSDPLLNSSASTTTPTPAAPPTFVKEKQPTKSKIANKSLIIAIVATILNLAICGVAVFICLSSPSTSTNSNPVAEDDTPKLPDSLQCEIEKCITELRFDLTVDQITNQLGITPQIATEASYVLSDTITLNVQTGQYPSFEYVYTSNSLIPSTNFTEEQHAEIKEHHNNSEDPWKLEDVEALVGKGQIIKRTPSDTTYIWANQETKRYFKIDFDTDDGLYSKYLIGPFNIY